MHYVKGRLDIQQFQLANLLENLLMRAIIF